VDPSAQLLQQHIGVVGIARLADNLVAEDDFGVGADDHRAGRGAGGGGLRFFGAQALDVVAGALIRARHLRHGGGNDVKAQAGEAQELAPPG
jgi:hypothetical protein